MVLLLCLREGLFLVMDSATSDSCGPYRPPLQGPSSPQQALAPGLLHHTGRTVPLSLAGLQAAFGVLKARDAHSFVCQGFWGPCLTAPSALIPRVDVNTDRRISAKEMQRWIMEKTAEHFQEAVKENKMHFRAVDPDGDGTLGPGG